MPLSAPLYRRRRGRGFGTLYRGSAEVPAGGLTVLAADTFNRADASGLGTSSSGHSWFNGASWSINSNRALQPPSTSYTVASLDASRNNVTVIVTAYPAGSGVVDIGLAARVIDSSNFIFLDVSWSTDHYVSRTFQRVSGTFTGLTSLVNPVPGIAARTDAMTLKLVVNGSAGESFINGTSMGTWSSIDSSLVTPTLHGIAVGADGTNKFDDLNIYAGVV